MNANSAQTAERITKRTGLNVMRIAYAAIIVLGCLGVKAYGATTLLPNGEQCFTGTTGISGMVGLLGTIVGGSGGTSGTYGGVSLTGGSGSGATATIVVSGGAVTSVTVLQPGIQYKTGDTLSAVSGTIGGVTGFSVPVLSTAINGSLAAGQVFMYVPNTTTPKQTWQDAAQTILNSEPIILDANGCAIIYGTGSYRQIVQDSLGNLVYDQLTTDTSANNNTFWAGTAGGTPNAITVVDPGFNGTDGSTIQFIPLFSNTGPATLNPSGFGAVPIVKDTTTGAVALSGGEMVANSPSNVVSVVYSASQANFHLLNLVHAAAATSPSTLCGTIGLKIVNDVTTPNSKVDLTADQVTMIAGSSVISRTSVSLILNLTINGANGLDTGSVTASTWYNVFAIDNGSGIAVLASTSATAPTLPSGYSYTCRVGAIRTDGSVNLYRTIQQGNITTYVVTPATNTANLPIIASSPVTFYTATSIAGFAPPTAFRAYMVLATSDGGAGGIFNAVAPNANYGTGSGGALTNPPPCFTSTAINQVQTVSCMINLETPQTVYYGSPTSRASLAIYGWQDKVNAN